MSTVIVMTEPLPGGVDRELRERRERRRRQQEHQRHHREQDRQRDLVRRPAALGAFDHRDHAIEEAFAFAAGDAHDDPVRQHARAAGHRGEVAAGLAQHGRRLAGHGAFVHRGDAFDDLAVRRNDVVGFDEHQVALAQAHPPRRCDTRVVLLLNSFLACTWRRIERSVAACALPRPSATASAKFANSTVSHSQTATARMNPGAALALDLAERGADADDRREDAADEHDEHHRIADLHARIELAEGVADRARAGSARSRTARSAVAPGLRPASVGGACDRLSLE